MDTDAIADIIAAHTFDDGLGDFEGQEVVRVDLLTQALADYFTTLGFQGCSGCLLCGPEGEAPSFDRESFIKKAKGNTN